MEIIKEIQEVKRALSQFKDEVLKAIRNRHFDDDPNENLNQLFTIILNSEEKKRIWRSLSLIESQW